MYIHTHMYTHTYVHTHMYTHTHTHMYIYTHAHSHTHTYMYTHTLTHTHIYVHTHMYKQTHTHTHRHTLTHSPFHINQTLFHMLVINNTQRFGRRLCLPDYTHTFTDSPTPTLTHSLTHPHTVYSADYISSDLYTQNLPEYNVCTCMHVYRQRECTLTYQLSRKLTILGKGRQPTYLIVNIWSPRVHVRN